jgi:hypothetical protein
MEFLFRLVLLTEKIAKQNRSLIKSPYISQRDFNETIENEIDTLLGIILINQ